MSDASASDPGVHRWKYPAWIKAIPTKRHGAFVYVILGEHGERLYVGESTYLRNRIKQHWRTWAQGLAVACVWSPASSDRDERLEAERRAIARLCPTHTCSGRLR